MRNIWNKLQLKDQHSLCVLNMPESFKPEVQLLKAEATVSAHFSKNVDFLLCFCTQQKDVQLIAEKIATVEIDDLMIWLAFPKKSSKKYASEINRDEGWKDIGDLGYEGVRIIAIDEDWSALRFKKVDQIKSFTRNRQMTISKAGAIRSKQKKK